MRDQDVVLNPHAADVPVLIQYCRVNVLGVDGVLQEGLDYEAAEVDLRRVSSALANTPEDDLHQAQP